LAGVGWFWLVLVGVDWVWRVLVGLGWFWSVLVVFFEFHDKNRLYMAFALMVHGQTNLLFGCNFFHKTGKRSIKR
jgi:hypothetical protein